MKALGAKPPKPKHKRCLYEYKQAVHYRIALLEHSDWDEGQCKERDLEDDGDGLSCLEHQKREPDYQLCPLCVKAKQARISAGEEK